MGNTKLTKYTVPKYAEEDINKKLNELLELCQIYKIPMFASVALENDMSHTKYKNIMFGGVVHGINLKEDHIQNHILIANGFKAVPPREEIMMDFSSNVN